MNNNFSEVVSSLLSGVDNVRNQDAVTKIIDMIPDLVDKFTAPKEDTDDMVSDEKAQEIAFGQDTL